MNQYVLSVECALLNPKLSVKWYSLSRGEVRFDLVTFVADQSNHYMPSTDTSSKNTNNLLPHIIKGIQERKGKDIVIMDLREISNAMCDYFVICSGTSDTNIQAITDNIEKTVREEMKEKATHIEGYSEAKWVLMDYFDIIVHVFNAEARSFYDLENLWADAKSEHLTD